MTYTDRNRYSRLFECAPELKRASNFVADNKEQIPLEVQKAFQELLIKLDSLLTEKNNLKEPINDCNIAYSSLLAEIIKAQPHDKSGILNGFKDAGIYPSLRSDSLQKIKGIRFSFRNRRLAKTAQAQSWQSNILSGLYPGRLLAKDIKDRGINGNVPVTVGVATVVIAATLLYPHAGNTPGVNTGRVAAEQLDDARVAVGDQIETVNSKATIDRTELEAFNADLKEADERAKTDALIDKLIAEKLAAEESAKRAHDQKVRAEESARKANAEKLAAESSPIPVNVPTAKANTPSRSGGACANLPPGVRGSLEAWSKNGKLLTPAEQRNAINAFEKNGTPRLAKALGAGGSQVNPQLVLACLSVN